MVNTLQHFFEIITLIGIILSEVDKEHADRLEKEGFICGKIREEGTSTSSAQSRVINGRITDNNRYPWLASIFVTVYKNGNAKSFRGGGSVISQQTILTCIHCVCINAEKVRQESEESCLPTPDGKNPVNQNREKENEVLYSIGVQELNKNGDSFNPNIKVYLYKYEPAYSRGKTPWIKNGDIAIVKDKSSLGLQLNYYRASPICLPAENTFSSDVIGRHVFDVTTAGRGKRFDAIVSQTPKPKTQKPKTVKTQTPRPKTLKTQTPKTQTRRPKTRIPKTLKPKRKFSTCFTNDALLNKNEGNPREVVSFLQCSKNSKIKKYCRALNNVKVTKDGKPVDQKKLLSMSHESRIVIINNIIKIQLYLEDDCHELWKKANNNYKKNNILSPGKSIEHDRIIIVDATSQEDFKKQYNFIKYLQIPQMGKICYNLRKVAKNGICKIDNPPSNFNTVGFCTRSCRVGMDKLMTKDKGESAPFLPYEEFVGILHDFPPSNSQETLKKGKLLVKQIP